MESYDISQTQKSLGCVTNKFSFLCAAACSCTAATQVHIVSSLQHTLSILRDWFHVPRTELVGCPIVPQNMVALPVAGWKIFTAGSGREEEREGERGKGRRERERGEGREKGERGERREGGREEGREVSVQISFCFSSQLLPW